MNLVGSGQDLGTGFVEQHGTYLSVMLARLLPDVTIHMENAPFDVNSNVRSWELASGESTIVADDYSLAAALTTRFSANPVDVLNLSLGTYGCPADKTDDQDEAPEDFRAPQATRDALLRVHLNDFVKFIVAAAGNDASQKRFYPAGFAGDPSSPRVSTGGRSARAMARTAVG